MTKVKLWWHLCIVKNILRYFGGKKSSCFQHIESEYLCITTLLCNPPTFQNLSAEKNSVYNKPAECGSQQCWTFLLPADFWRACGTDLKNSCNLSRFDNDDDAVVYCHMLCENIQISWLRWLIDNDHLRVNCVWGCCQRGKSIYLWKEDLIFFYFP